MISLAAPNQILKKNFGMLVVLNFKFVIFGFMKKIMFRKCFIDKEIGILEIADNNALEIMTLLNNLVLFCKFYNRNLKFCLLYMIREIRVFC